MKQIFLGLDPKGEQVINSAETLKQINEIKKLECAIVIEEDSVDWKNFDEPTEPGSLFQYILNDRKIRVDQKTLMADRPPFAVLTIDGQKVIRIEFYEGHNSLELTYDLRCKELQDKNLSVYLKKDPNAHDPKEVFRWMPPALADEILKKLHENE